MERVRELVAQIAPKAAFPGQWQLTLAIFYYRRVSTLDEGLPTLVTKEVYPLVSRETGRKLSADEKPYTELSNIAGRMDRMIASTR